MTSATATPLSWHHSSEAEKPFLIAASETWENTAASEQFIRQALAQPEPTLDALVSAYRFFFYKNNNPMALQMAQQVMARIKAVEGFPDNWAQLQPLLAARKEDPPIRLYLNAYAASGFVLARLGQTEEALTIATQVKSLDDRNEFGAGTVLDILTRPADDDD